MLIQLRVTVLANGPPQHVILTGWAVSRHFRSALSGWVTMASIKLIFAFFMQGKATVSLNRCPTCCTYSPGLCFPAAGSEENYPILLGMGST